MNFRMGLFLTSLLFFVSCSPKSPTERLIGSWSLDVSCTLRADKEISHVSDAMRTRIEQFVRPYIRHIIFEFDEDGIYRIRRRLSQDRDQVYDRYYYRILETNDNGRLSIESSPHADFTANQPIIATFENDQLRTQIGDRIYCLKPY